MATGVADLRDAQLVLADVRSLLQRRVARLLVWRPTSRGHVDDDDALARLEQHLAAAVLDDGATLTVDPAIHAAVAARAPWAPLPPGWTAYGERLRAGIDAADALARDLESRVAAAGDGGWRRLGPATGRRGRFTSKNSRQQYRANVAAG